MYTNPRSTQQNKRKRNKTHGLASRNIKQLSVSLVTDITFIQARQLISDEAAPAESDINWRD